MLSTMERLSVYSVLCVISICSLLLQMDQNVSLLPVSAFFGSVAGIWLEAQGIDASQDKAKDN
ncbi:hypothetical protein [Vibrio sp. WXL103]|uniref:hypothetical protein n=1 Tax=Vibrio sp. WXL103 TaxID=3450710 RepID=UPI003EC4C57A